VPLKKAPKGASKATRQKIASANISEMMHAGHPQNQSIAAGMRAAGMPKPKKKRKG
jgi:hypothetical protein